MRAPLVAALMVLACGRVHFDPVGGNGDGSLGDGFVIGDGVVVTANIAFVTSTAQPPGTLGGLDGADTLCMQLAHTAGLPGNYVAWLSTPTSNAIDRLGASRGWVRPDGRPIVDTLADLVAAKFYYPLELDERGVRVPYNTVVTTGTESTGLWVNIQNVDCSGYTSTSGENWQGETGITMAYWTSVNGSGSGCADPSRLYCFGVGAMTPAAPSPPSPARREFVLFNSFDPASGLLAADSACQTAATTAGYTGMFLALLATTGATAISRFNTSGPPWVRPDDVAIVAVAADLTTGDIIASPDVTVGLQYAGPQQGVWVGAMGPGVAGTDATSCQAWTKNQGSFSGQIGLTTSAGIQALNYETDPCSYSEGVYCLEQ